MTPITPPRAEDEHHHGRSLEELLQFECSLRWIGVGLGLSGLLWLALRRIGWPLAAVLLPAGAVGAGYATLLEPRLPRLERVTLRLPQVPPELAGLRIGHLSDMHLGVGYGLPNSRWAVQQMVQAQPDLLVLTGDFVTKASSIADLPDLLRPLHAPLGVYAITGNHDHWEGVDAVLAALESVGIVPLHNENRHLTWRGGSFWLAGIDDIWYGAPDLSATLQGIPEEALTLLLAHEPDLADVAAERHVDVQLSGHTHGGQITLPLLGAFCLPRLGLRYARGSFQIGPMHLYVSRGLGGLPVRFHCPPEATLITLERQGNL